MPSWPATCGCSSIFILTSLTLPPAAATAFSSAGANCLQGPHQGAQKSTKTGCLVEATSTSSRNDAVVTSLTAAPPCVGPPAIIRSNLKKKNLLLAPRWAQLGLFAMLGRRSARFGERDDQRLVAGRSQKRDEIAAGEAGRARVD